MEFFLVTGPTGSGNRQHFIRHLMLLINRIVKLLRLKIRLSMKWRELIRFRFETEVGMTFSAALRSMLRQAPNIVMVGEIRDLETAEIAINASLTGHMVFSTLHTNDAPSSVSRLIDMGVKPFLVSASLRSALLND